MLTLSEVGARIAEARRDAGMQQAEFAQALGVSLRSLAGYERGEREPPGELLVALYKISGVNPAWILLGPKHAFKKPKAPVAIGAAVLADLEAQLTALKKSLSPDVKAQVFEVLFESALERDSVDSGIAAKVLTLTLKQRGES